MPEPGDPGPIVTWKSWVLTPGPRSWLNATISQEGSPYNGICDARSYEVCISGSRSSSNPKGGGVVAVAVAVGVAVAVDVGSGVKIAVGVRGEGVDVGLGVGVAVADLVVAVGTGPDVAVAGTEVAAGEELVAVAAAVVAVAGRVVGVDTDPDVSVVGVAVSSSSPPEHAMANAENAAISAISAVRLRRAVYGNFRATRTK